MRDAKHTPKILVLAGSTRLDSMHRKLARQTVEALRHAGLEATLADLRDFPMPIYDGDLEAGEGIPPAAKALKDLARQHDGFAIASPEYNGSFPALLKNALDWISRPEPGDRPLEVFRGRVAAILSASPGPGGGKRGLHQLRELLEMMSVSVIPQELAIAKASAAFDSAGRLTRAEDVAALQDLAAALAQAAARNIKLEKGFTMITIRKSNQRGHANHGWLDTSHTFSFASYYDPKQMGFGPLRVINEDRVSPGKGFGSHGHEDMEILTYVLSGALSHKDSMGNVETLHANDLQRISAGSGIIHSEFNGSPTEPVHFLQIWLEPAVNGLRPSYQQLSLTEEQKVGKLVLVASPEGGGPLKIHQDAEVLIGQVEAGKELAHQLEVGRQAWVHLIRGAATVNGQPLTTGDAAAVTGETSLRLGGIDANSEVLLFDLA